MNWIRKCAISAFIVLLVYFVVAFLGNEEQIPTEMGFEESLQFVLKWEGGYVNDPNDPGGETNFGISKRAYPDEDIKNMTIERATEIYYRDYWLGAGCDKLPEPLNIVVFNCSVNCGKNRAKKILNISWDWRDFLLKQIKYYANLKGAKYYLRGWINRTIDLFNLIKENKNEQTKR